MAAYSSEPDLTTVKEHLHTGSGVGGIKAHAPHTGSSKIPGEYAHVEDSQFSNSGPKAPDRDHHNMDGLKHFFEGQQDGNLLQNWVDSANSAGVNAYHALKTLVSDYRTDGNRLSDEAATEIAEARYSEDYAEALPAQRNLRLGEDTELMTRGATEAPMRGHGTLLTGEWSVPQLAGVGMGLLVLNSVAGKVF